MSAEAILPKDVRSDVEKREVMPFVGGGCSTALETVRELVCQSHELGIRWCIMGHLQGRRVHVFMCSAGAMSTALLTEELGCFSRQANQMFMQVQEQKALLWDDRHSQVSFINPGCEVKAEGAREPRIALLADGQVCMRTVVHHDPGDTRQMIDWEVFENLAEAAARRIVALNERQANGRRFLHDPESDAYCSAYFLDCVDREIERSRRHSTPLSLTVVQLMPLDAMACLPSAIHERVVHHITGAVRRTDIVGRMDVYSYGAFFHHCGPRDALIAAGRIAEAIREDEDIARRLLFALGVSGWEAPDDDALTLVLRAREAAIEALETSPGHPFIAL